MNVEITDNSKEVSGAIHQVGQAMADTGSLLQTWESQQQGRCIEQWSFAIPGSLCGHCGLSANGKVWCNKAAGMRPALRLRRKSLSHLLPVSWSFYWELSKTDTFSCTGTQELVQ